MLRNFDTKNRKSLVDVIAGVSPKADYVSSSERFSRLCSIVQHHDKFGVVSTGEGALPIFSDILYFASDGNNPESKKGILKNVTQVMLLNLADIAAVSRVKHLSDKKFRSLKLAFRIGELRASHANKQLDNVIGDELRVEAEKLEKAAKECEQRKEFKLAADKRAKADSLKTDQAIAARSTAFRDEHNTEATCLQGLTEICSEEDSCLGLRYRKVKAVFDDWKLLVAAIDHTSVDGNRGRLKLRLLEIEQSPSRAITRILRLLHETADTIMEAPDASNPLDRYLDAASVETVLVGTLGAHQFQTFCRDFASVAKLDYGLRFFQAIMCGCIRASLGSKPIRPRGAWDRLNNDEIDALNALAKSETEISKLAERIALLFVKVLECLVSRYKEVLEPVPSQPRRFGFQLRDLTGDNKIREKIVDLLNQFPETEPAALTWIADEVTIWSMD